jgi:pyruvate/2-oxoglutarate/acetoin dehydrogenase E1 component
VHSSDESSIFNPNSGVTIIKDTSEYYMKLINEMAIYLGNSRPVILFFEHNKSLNQFLNSENFKDKKYPY